MKEDLLQEFRKDYEKRLDDNLKNRNNLAVLMKRKALLENSTLVKDYINLVNDIKETEDDIYTDYEVFSETLHDYMSMGLAQETNDIYLYIGSYVNEGGYNRKTERDDINAEFDSYINIESFVGVEIPVEDREVFEKEHKVLLIDESIPMKYLIHELREDFIKDALLNGQEEACKKVLSRNKKNL